MTTEPKATANRFRFRAWNTKSGKMWNDGKPWDFSEMCGWEDWPRDCLFDDLILMQSTGLLDKNGKEIFEGDIVRGHHQYSGGGGQTIAKRHEKISVVKYDAPHHGIAGFHIWPINFDEFPIEVIGNIYENPDLLPKAQ